ncbi:MAG: hypothetical protein LKF87_14855 [Clostridium tyrobutyricum]|uniref:hypothetical protein n=1 Tax=Clostridium tyrobutyricum TaxID=1519 RepID=UPI0011CB5E37|nr:hypothetical protein [Clostridium tyrobutyricum]MCH4200714.1 hypothetical protein [Clostridium tyrobutyricum]MCH4260194.1 hypothetical protein [Clostridium tyrobutyricum]
MKYIKSEEFRSWWNPDFYDLFFRNFSEVSNNFIKGIYIGCIQDKTWLPILTEGQLRRFIEEKTNGKIDLNYYKSTGGYDLTYYTGN